MTTTLPPEVQQVFERFVTTEYTAIDTTGQPITWPVTPYHNPSKGSIDVTTGLGYPKKARDAQHNGHVSLLFSDPTGSGLDRPAAVLVQGTADVDDRDLEANRKRYVRESLQKLPATKGLYPPEFVQRFAEWYFTRIYVHVRPERIYVWASGDFTKPPQLLDSHLEEVRSRHSEEPTVTPAAPDANYRVWDERMRELGDRYDTGVLTIVGPDGFPLSARVPISVDLPSKLVRIGELPAGLPFDRGRVCLTVHDHAPDFTWQQNFHVRGTLERGEDGWILKPQKLVGGFELPPGRLKRVQVNVRKVLRFRRTAKREMKRGTATV